jgi:hypothetical protein
MLITTLLLLTWIAIEPAEVPTSSNTELGHQIELPESTLFVPKGYQPSSGHADLLLHLHGSVPVVERALVESGWNVALLVFNRKGLSSAYEAPFSDVELFPRLLNQAHQAIVEKTGNPHLVIGRVFVSSFSAGFGGVRALLRSPRAFARIDGLILADSLYAGYLDDHKGRGIDSEKMAGFRRFAAEATAGRKSMLVTHSDQVPDGYASTTETADDLLVHVGLTATPTSTVWKPNWRTTRRAARGRFLVMGFAGDGPEDHLKHLRHIGRIWIAARAL